MVWKLKKLYTVQSKTDSFWNRVDFYEMPIIFFLKLNWWSMLLVKY